MNHNRSVADFPNITVSVIVELDDCICPACKRRCERFVEQLDSNNDVLVALLSVFVGDQLDHRQGRVDRIAFGPTRQIRPFDEMTGVVWKESSVRCPKGPPTLGEASTEAILR